MKSKTKCYGGEGGYRLFKKRWKKDGLLSFHKSSEQSELEKFEDNIKTNI